MNLLRQPLPMPGRWRDAVLRAGPWAVLALWLLVLGAVVLAYRWLDPTPPKRIVIASGPEQGAYAEFAKRYRPLLQAHGITVTLRATQGSNENLALLHDAASGVQAAFVQGGVATEERQARASATASEDGAAAAAGPPPLLSLGSVAYEPLWIFYREASARRLAKGAKGAKLDRLSQLEGWRINLGPEGDGSGPLFRQLAAANRLSADALKLGDRAAVNGVVDLVQGRIDALVMVSAADAPLVQYLLRTPGMRLFDFAQAEAYARRFPFLRPVVLPRGVVDLANDLPPADVHLLATTASLVVREDLHPALMELLLQAAKAAHGGPGVAPWFNRSDVFPNAEATEWPLAREAERFHRSGPPWLQRYLPFWLANFVDRMWIVLLPLLAALVPLSRILPPLVTLRMRSRVFRWYAHLRALEEGLEKPDANLAQLRDELDRIEAQVEHIGLPLAYHNELYDLRSHIDLVRRRLRARAAP
ncbi:MAG: C4-dicarboxylate ABC transporter substrate-binding protein [Rubrivivax sp.]|nr:C4-dicarboxylate ABC transporter substrate-binding protein [Rubrivivax sp.]